MAGSQVAKMKGSLLRSLLPAALVGRLEPGAKTRAGMARAGRRAVAWSVAALVLMLSVNCGLDRCCIQRSVWKTGTIVGLHG